MRLKSPYKGRFKVSQIYKGASHKGLDLVGMDDKTIYSTVTGTVEAARHDTHPTGGMGLYIRIKDDKDKLYYYFAHLSEICVKPGQYVREGDKLGVEGNTGNSTGSHLHYEIRSSTNNMTFLDVSRISKIPNKLGVYKMPDIKDVTITIGQIEVDAKLIDGVTYAPLRELIDSIKSELDVTWDNVKGAGIKL